MLLVNDLLNNSNDNRCILDFDGAVYHITNSRDKPFTVSIKLKFFRDLQQHGTDEVSSFNEYHHDIRFLLGPSTRIWRFTCYTFRRL